MMVVAKKDSRWNRLAILVRSHIRHVDVVVFERGARKMTYGVMV
jgi:hypothetical protein